MIAYKVFRKINGNLFPFWVSSEFQHYPIGFTHTRAVGCGPFTCFNTIGNAVELCNNWKGIPTVIYRVRIKKSKDRSGWINNATNLWWRRKNSFEWGGTIYADEFEILERVK